ncbi:hypothetical protein TNCV_4724611 [Trichonephila clavipes]|uniref:Uncharacterized protein n=1 Tax=Trichonephila clavipes TaxID=2585209 RepID=A0A8X6W6Q9_TRICX|nr:hypothetical protein TNCV_4724611 [Trichonephila clavipes]
MIYQRPVLVRDIFQAAGVLTFLLNCLVPIIELRSSWTSSHFEPRLDEADESWEVWWMLLLTRNKTMNSMLLLQDGELQAEIGNVFGWLGYMKGHFHINKLWRIELEFSHRLFAKKRVFTFYGKPKLRS